MHAPPVRLQPPRAPPRLARADNARRAAQQRARVQRDRVKGVGAGRQREAVLAQQLGVAVLAIRVVHLSARGDGARGDDVEAAAGGGRGGHRGAVVGGGAVAAARSPPAAAAAAAAAAAVTLVLALLVILVLSTLLAALVVVVVVVADAADADLEAQVDAVAAPLGGCNNAVASLVLRRIVELPLSLLLAMELWCPPIPSSAAATPYIPPLPPPLPSHRSRR